MARSDLDRLVTPRAILIAGWVVFMIYAYPGYMSYDSVWQLQQARHLEPYNDWHPPMMAVLWHVTDKLIAGPFPMLVLQSLAYLLGCNAILRHVMARRAAAVVAVLLLVMPQSIVVLAVIWKDSQMASYLLAAIALLLSDRRPLRVAGYFLIFVATGMRYNAAAATLPIVVLLFARDRAGTRWRRYGLGLALWLGLTALALVTSALLVEQRSHVWEKSVAPVDLAGIVRYLPGLADDELRADTPGVRWVAPDHIRDAVRLRYHPDGNFLDTTENANKVIEAPGTAAELAAIAAAWKTMATKHPWALLRHRIAVFRALLSTHTGGAVDTWSEFTNADWAEVQLVHRARHADAQAAWIEAVVAWDRRFGLRVWAYLVLALALLPMCRSRLPVVLLGSGLLHELGLFLVAPAPDYRYSHWMVVACLLAAVVLFVERRRTGSSATGAPRVLGHGR